MSVHPAQLLFDRVVITWLLPHVERLRREAAPDAPPVKLHSFLVFWPDTTCPPEVLLNDDAKAMLKVLSVRADPSAIEDGSLPLKAIEGLDRIGLKYPHHHAPFIFSHVGRNENWFAKFARLQHLKWHREFLAVETQLSGRGLQLLRPPAPVSVHLDLIRNHYVGPPARKRLETLQWMEHYVATASRRARQVVTRHRRLPALIAMQNDQVTPLLEQARTCYAEGLNFSAIVSAATAADRICLVLVDRYEVPRDDKKKILGMTLGQKLEKLFSLYLLSEDQLQNLRRLNRVRNRYIHPQQQISTRQASRDARLAVELLHRLVEDTLSMYRDHTISKGKFVPAPLD